MRFLLIIVVLALVLAIIGFTVTNIETLTTITLWQTTYRDVPLWSVVFLSALAGVVSVGIIGVVDGALVRLRNRQMSRELHRLETELNFLRTQPSPARREPDLPGGPEIADDEAVAVEAADAKGVLASAPVYHADDADDDDPYTGGRAV
jgi:uncharacterized membrane protein YciS (DUF1049 family)